MNAVPRWFRPTALAALIWNLFGCAAYLADVRMTSEDIALFGVARVQSEMGWTPVLLQGVVLVVSIGLLVLARRSIANGWVSS